MDDDLSDLIIDSDFLHNGSLLQQQSSNNSLLCCHTMPKTGRQNNSSFYRFTFGGTLK